MNGNFQTSPSSSVSSDNTAVRDSLVEQMFLMHQRVLQQRKQKLERELMETKMKLEAQEKEMQQQGPSGKENTLL